MKKYKVVEINCHKNIVRKIPIYGEHYRNITPNQLEEKLNVLVKSGWNFFEVIIDGKKQQKVLINKNPNSQAKIHADTKSPDKSVVDNDESRSNPVKSRKNCEKKQCPECGSSDTIPIQYGFPSPEMMNAADKGKIRLGGCVIKNDSPDWHCKACQLDFKK